MEFFNYLSVNLSNKSRESGESTSRLACDLSVVGLGVVHITIIKTYLVVVKTREPPCVE